MTLLYRSSRRVVFTAAPAEKVFPRMLANPAAAAPLEIPIGGPISLSSRRS